MIPYTKKLRRTGDIRIGTSGYSFKDWKGNVYPADIKESEMFSCCVDQYRLNTVEINYTYYRLPIAKTFDCLIWKSPKDFDFTVKLFGGITHEPIENYPPAQADTHLCSQFLEGIRPLVESGKLGCILAQFPARLQRSPEAWKYLMSLPKALSGLPLVYEFRNKGWVCKETMDMLKEAGIGFCAVDEPQVGSLMPLVPMVTSEIAYLRLHGRNTNWYTDPSQRYDYFYSEDELKKFIPTINSMASRSSTIYVQFNNCHSGAALRNVKMLQALLGMDFPPMQRGLF